MHSKEKIKKIRERAIIREYIDRKINLLLKEYDDDFGDYGAGGYGGRPGSAEFTLGVFGLTGIMNVGRVALGVGESIITRVLGEAWILARRLWYTINPAYFAMSAEELENIIRQDRSDLDARLNRVHAGYADTVRDAEKVIEHMGGDLNAVMFLANPGATVGYMASRGAVGAARNLYHRVAVGGPPPAMASREESLASRAAELEREHEELRSEMSRRGEASQDVMRNFARELLGPNATPEDLRNFIRTSRTATATAAAPPATTAMTEQFIPNRPVAPSPRYPAVPTPPVAARGTPTMAPISTPRMAANVAPPSTPVNTTQRLNDLTRRTQELKRDYIAFLNSNELKRSLANQPVVQEGQRALTNMIVENYRNVISDLTFESMRQQHSEEFAKLEQEDPTVFDSEEKRNAFVQYARQQLKTPVIAQLQALSQENPSLREEANNAIRTVERLAEQGTG